MVHACILGVYSNLCLNLVLTGDDEVKFEEQCGFPCHKLSIITVLLHSKCIYVGLFVNSLSFSVEQIDMLSLRKCI